MAQAQAPPMTLPERVVDYIGFSSAALEKAANERKGATAQREKVSALIPAAVDALLSGERITEDQREKAAAVLADPVQALELLTKVAVHRNTGEYTLGGPADGQVKTASADGAGNNGQYNSLEDPRCGVRTGMTKQSDNRLFSGLGLNRPPE